MARMRRPPALLVIAPALVLALLAPGPGLAAEGPYRAPVLEFEGPRRFDGEIGELRWVRGPAVGTLADWLELEDPGPPLRVVLAPEDHPLARSMPRWVSGYAVPEEDLAVLLPDRVIRYPYDDLAELFLHEVAHVLSHRAAGGAELPRWFREGVALHAARGWTLADRRHALAAGLSGGPATLSELEAAFGGSPGEVGRAYSLAGFLVEELVQDRGSDVVARILRRVRYGADFPTAFEETAGSTLASWSSGVWRRYRIWYRWVPFVTSGATLWMLVTGLAVLAAIRRRRRDAEIKERWAAEEHARSAPPPVPPTPPEEDGIQEGRGRDGEWIH